MHQIICKPLTASVRLHYWTGSAWTTRAAQAQEYATREAALAEVRRIMKGVEDTPEAPNLSARRAQGHVASWPAGCLHPQAVSAKMATRKAARLARA